MIVISRSLGVFVVRLFFIFFIVIFDFIGFIGVWLLGRERVGSRFMGL